MLDESDSSYSYPSDDDSPCSPCELEAMSSSSSDSDASKKTSPPCIFLKVKESVEERSRIARFRTVNITDDLSTYFDHLVSSGDKPTFYPKAMKVFLDKNHPKVVDSLGKLHYGEFFFFIGKTVIVTLNVDNKRVRIPRSLICDVCVFSHSHPVLVLSFVTPGYKREKLDIYNTFAARGITEAIRNFASNNISVVNGVIVEGTDVSTVLPQLQERSALFHISSSLSIHRQKATASAIALLRSMALSAAYPILQHRETEREMMWFLTKNEFDVMSEFIDMEPQKFLQTASGDKDVLALELSIRRSKRDNVALLVTSVLEKLNPSDVICFRNLTLRSPELDYSKYTLFIADQFKDIQGTTDGRKASVIISSSKTDAKAVKRYIKKNATKPHIKRETNQPSWFQRLFLRKKHLRSVDIAKQSLNIGSVSTPNLRSFPEEESSDHEDEQNSEHSTELQAQICISDLQRRRSISFLGQYTERRDDTNKGVVSNNNLPEIEGDFSAVRTKEQTEKAKMASNAVMTPTGTSVPSTNTDTITQSENNYDDGSSKSKATCNTPVQNKKESNKRDSCISTISSTSSASSGYDSSREEKEKKYSNSDSNQTTVGEEEGSTLSGAQKSKKASAVNQIEITS